MNVVVTLVYPKMNPLCGLEAVPVTLQQASVMVPIKILDPPLIFDEVRSCGNAEVLMIDGCRIGLKGRLCVLPLGIFLRPGLNIRQYPKPFGVTGI